jgi:hypothetical protein
MINPIFGGGAIDGINLSRVFINIESSLGKGYIDVTERSKVNIFCIVSPTPIPIVPSTYTNTPPLLRPCPQYIRLTFFVATTNQYLIQKCFVQ